MSLFEEKARKSLLEVHKDLNPRFERLLEVIKIMEDGGENNQTIVKMLAVSLADGLCYGNW